MTLNGVMAVTLRYFTEFGRSVAECTSLLYFVVRVRCSRTESSRSLSHLLVSFLFIHYYATEAAHITLQTYPLILHF